VSTATEVEPHVLPRADHPISRSAISENTLKVLYRLHKAGYKGYLVGGGVRDLMLGRTPKDFDVATDAQPSDVRRLFRNSRIIGRRFRLVHVFFRGEVVEVSTFRRVPDPDDQDSADDDLLITSDNTYGTPREDAFRRDFTVNALFYDIGDFSVIDYVGGTDDLAARLIRAIGDPDVRFQEDPVRMLRACEFAGRLSFGIEAGTQEAIERQRHGMEKASKARLTEEALQLLRCGHSGRVLQWMLDLGLLEIFLPEAYSVVSAGRRESSDLVKILPAMDAMVRDGRELSDAALLAVLLLPSVMMRRNDVEAVDQRPISRTALGVLVAEVAQPLSERFTLSRERTQHVERALTGFLRMCEPGWDDRGRNRLAGRPFFADALALFEMMVTATGEGAEPLAGWQGAAGRRAAGGGGEDEGDEDGGRSGGGGRRRRRRRRRPRRRGRGGGGGG
jgi:poly(A) polymerase